MEAPRQPRQSEVLGLKLIDDQWFTETDRERGTSVHKAVNAILRELFVPPLKINQGYVDSFVAWKEAMVKQVLYAEGWACQDGVWSYVGPLVSKLGFTGMPDFIGLLTGEITLAVVDWKTSLTKQKIWQLQVSGAYRILAEENNYKPIGRCLSLRLEKNGGQAKPTEYGDMMDVAFFCRALDLWRFVNS